jgi:tRNA1Val (adenine37-N6)-methyltransferase
MEGCRFYMDIPLKQGERIDDLQYKGLKIIQNPKFFCFGMDAVLLAHFTEVRKGDRVIDLGTGTAIIPILLAGRTMAAEILGIDIQPHVLEMAGRSLLMNGLEDKVKLKLVDIRRVAEQLPRRAFDVVVSNPPYKRTGSGIVNPNEPKAISRHEVHCTIDGVIDAAAYLLKPGGRFYMIHRPERLAEIIYLMKQRGMEPKVLRMVHPAIYKKANIILISGTLGGRPFLKVEEPLYVYNQDGSYTGEINQIYHREGSNG